MIWAKNTVGLRIGLICQLHFIVIFFQICIIIIIIIIIIHSVCVGGEWIKNSEINYFLLMYRLFQLLGIWGKGANPFLFIELDVFVQAVQT